MTCECGKYEKCCRVIHSNARGKLWVKDKDHFGCGKVQEQILELNKLLTGNKMSEFKDYRRKQIAELTEITKDEISFYKKYGVLEAIEEENESISTNVSISDADKANGSPKLGDMIARNPKNHEDQWLVAKEYFKANFEPINGKSESTIVNEAFEKKKTDRIDNIVRLNKLKEMIYINKWHGNKLKHDVAFQLINEIRETL